jgi:hypothetical protein
MRATSFAFALASGLAAFIAAGSARADDAPLPCRTAFENQRADVDGPVVSFTDRGHQQVGIGRYHIIVRDHFTGCRVSDDTDSVCKVGQHAAIVGGGFGIWYGDVKGSDSDYVYEGSHIWDCGQ